LYDLNSRQAWAQVGAHTRGVFEANKQLQDSKEISESFIRSFASQLFVRSVGELTHSFNCSIVFGWLMVI
jgi:hypothetical protein